jgi:hypothetical protein
MADGESSISSIAIIGWLTPWARCDQVFVYLLSPSACQPCWLPFFPLQAANSCAKRLAKQLQDLEVPFVDDFSTALQSADHVVDAIFGSCPLFPPFFPRF